MEHDPDILQVASVLLRNFGPRAALVIQDRADYQLGMGDEDGGDFWWRVTLALRDMETKGFAALH